MPLPGPVTLRMEGAVLSTRTEVVVGAVKAVAASLPATSRIVPPSSVIEEETLMPSESLSPLCTV